MHPGRLTLCSFVALAGVAAATAGCASQHASSARSAVPHVAANRSTPLDRRASPSSAADSAVRAFAASYGGYLDGRLPATALAHATPAAQARAGAPVPADDRVGSLAVAYIHRSPRGDSFTVGYRDRAHSYSAQLVVARHRARWQITQVAAPDLDSILRRSRAIPLTAGSRPAATAARRFLRGYLTWLYGHARVTAIHAATSQLIGQLRTHPPRVPITLQQVTPLLVALGTQSTRGAWLVLANIAAGQQTYQLTVTVARSRGRWRVTKVNAPF
jgi:hypothetical protein